MIIDAHLHFSRHEHMGVIAREAGHVNTPGHLKQVFRECGIALGVVMGNHDAVACGRQSLVGFNPYAARAAEWTRSAYRPYPYRADDGREDESAEGPKVVRGGSFASRPRNATSSFRQAYLPWQKVYDTGFRVVFEDD